MLLVAAALKADSFLNSSTSWSSFFTAALVFAELIMAGLLFSGAMPLVTWWATPLCFSCFLLVASVKLLRGEVDYGCFGAVATPPWVTMTIDLSAVAALTFKHHEWRVSVPATVITGLAAMVPVLVRRMIEPG